MGKFKVDLLFRVCSIALSEYILQIPATHTLQDAIVYFTVVRWHESILSKT